MISQKVHPWNSLHYLWVAYCWRVSSQPQLVLFIEPMEESSESCSFLSLVTFVSFPSLVSFLYFQSPMGFLLLCPLQEGKIQFRGNSYRTGLYCQDCLQRANGLYRVTTSVDTLGEPHCEFLRSYCYALLIRTAVVVFPQPFGGMFYTFWAHI